MRQKFAHHEAHCVVLPSHYGWDARRGFAMLLEQSGSDYLVLHHGREVWYDRSRLILDATMG